jgi:ribose transport system substrate-binding protein
MKMKKKFIAISVCLLMAFALVGVSCKRSQSAGQEARSAGKPKIAVVLKTLSSPYWQAVLKGAKEGAAQYGFDLVELGPPTEDAVIEQINMMQDVISKGEVVGIIFSPSQPPTAVNVLNMAKERGIPVAVIDTPMPDGYTDFLTYIGSNNFNIGVLGAQQMLKVLPEGGSVLIIEGAPGNPATTERADGAEKTFRDAGIVIQSRQPGYSDRERSFTIMQNILQTGDVDGVFCSNDDMAEGAYRALAQSNKRTVFVMGVDGNQSAKESVSNGGMFGTVAQDAAGMGLIGVESIHSFLNGQDVEKKIDAPSPVITKDNVAQHL